MELDIFKQGCIKSKSDFIVQKFIIDDTSHFFDKVVVGKEFDFKKDIADMLNIHIRDVAIVGSGKLGFSLKPEVGGERLYRFKEFDYAYNKSSNAQKSDLDIAVISSSLFDKEIQNLYDFSDFYKNNWLEKKSLAIYALKGRLATRFLPTGFPLTVEISRVQDKYRAEYGREVNIEIYKSWYYFETYHEANIKNIHVNLISSL